MSPQKTGNPAISLSTRNRWAAAALGVMGLLSLTSGCKVTDEDIDTWKRTVKGPGKMVAVLLADKYELDLRTHAAVAMVEMERQDVDGVAELQRALQQLDGDVRDQVIEGVTGPLIELMNTSDEETKESGASASAAQVRAKDAAFLLISLANPDSRQKLTEAVVGWYVEDFNGRNLTGNFSAEQVVRALGAPAATQLVEALNSKLPQQTVVKLAELIGQLGRPETRKKAGAKLVAMEAEMQGDGFKAWLTGKINEQLAAAGKKLDPAKVAKMAELNRGNFIDGGVIPAMKYLADQGAVAGRLIQIAADGQGSTVRRTRALQALEGKAKPEHLDRLLAVALDAKNPATVRDYAFDRVGDIRSPKAIPSLWPLVQDASQGRLRWRAGELVLAIGGAGVLSEFLAKLPASKDVTYEPEELEGYATRMGQMSPQPRDIAGAQLRSPNWWHQVIGLKYFERKGSGADTAKMQRLSGSKTATAGKKWGEAKTVGKVAEQAIAGLRDRLKQTAAAGQKGGAS